MENRLYTYKALCERVIDGDTFDLTISVGFDIYKKERVRLSDIDTPETWRPSCEAERQHGELATLKVKELIEGKEVILKTYSKKGKYGRRLCKITIDGMDLSDFIRDNGLAKRDSY